MGMDWFVLEVMEVAAVSDKNFFSSDVIGDDSVRPISANDSVLFFAANKFFKLGTADFSVDDVLLDGFWLSLFPTTAATTVAAAVPPPFFFRVGLLCCAVAATTAAVVVLSL
jgi:hypothetical protein